MRALIIYLVILVSLSARLAISTQTTELQWQLPVEEENVNGQHSDQKKPQLHIRLQGCYGKGCPSEQKRSDSVDDSVWLSSPLNLLLMTEPSQVVHICAGQLQAEDGKLPDSLMSITTSLNEGYIYQIRPRSMMTPLTLINPIRCPKQFGHLYDYNAGKVFFSDKPFLVRFYPKQTTKKINHNDASGALSSDMTPTTPATIPIGGGGFDPGVDDLFPKRPGRGFITNAPDISLTLLPLVRLDWDWQHLLPLNNWRQWIFGTRDESSGVVIQIRIDGRPVNTLQLSQQEFQQLLPSLTDTKTALRWLASKLNGREALIDRLLQWSSAESPIPSELRKAIEQQLATVLEYDDHEFTRLHLDFEVHQLQKTLTGEPSDTGTKQPPLINSDPSQWIVKQPEGSDKSQQQGERSAQKESGNDKSQKGNSQATSRGNPENASGGENSDNQPPAHPPTGSDSEATTSASQPVTITFIGQVNAGKSSLANCLLQVNHFDSMEVQNKDYERDFKDLPGIVKIRSLPGYGNGKTVRSGQFLKKYPIAPEEIVIMVMASEMDDMDETVLKGLLENGHSPKRILLVRNKFDEELRARPERKNLIPGTHRAEDEKGALKKKLEERQQKVLKELQQESSARLTAPLQTLIDRYDEDHPGRLLIFTSASDVSTFKADQDKALLDAIETALTTQQGDKQEWDRFKKQFIDIRPGNAKELADFIRQQFLDVIGAVRAGNISSENAFALLLERLNNTFGLQPVGTVGDWEEKFKTAFGGDFNKKTDDSLREGEPEQETIEQQFIDFYTRHILGSVWYQFVGKMQQEEKEENPYLGQTAMHLWARNGQAGWVWLWLQLNSEQTKELLTAQDNNRRTPLHLAVYSGSEETVECILKKGGDPNAKDKFDYTPLHWAAYFGRVEIADLLLRHGAALSGNNRSRITPLHLAAWCNQNVMIKKLLDRGAELNAKTYEDELPLHYAAASGSIRSLKVLLESKQTGIDTKTAYGFTALHLAAWYNRREALAYLTEQRADTGALTPDKPNAEGLLAYRGYEVPSEIDDLFSRRLYFRPYFSSPLPPLADLESNKQDQYGFSPLHRWVLEGDSDWATDWLSVHDSSDQWHDKEGLKPLHLAAACGHAGLVRLLITDFDADVEAKDRVGNAPLHLAAFWGQDQIVKDLISFGADPAAENNQGIQAIHWIAARGQKDMFEYLATALRSEGKHTAEICNNGFSTLHAAAKYGNVHLVISFCKTPRIDLESIMTDGTTPLHLAARYGQANVVAQLRAAGVAPDSVNSRGQTAMHLATQSNHLHVLVMLAGWANPEIKCENIIDNQAITPAKNCRQLNALHIAAAFGFVEAVDILVRAGANILATDSLGWTALHFAASHGHCKTIQLLVEKFPSLIDVPTSFSQMEETPLSFAMKNGQSEAVSLLKALRVSSTKRKDMSKDMGMYLLIQIIKDETIDVLEKELKDGLDPNKKMKGAYPLHFAVFSGQVLCIKLLVQKGANPYAKCDWNGDYFTPLEMAVNRNSPEAVKALLEVGCLISKSEPINTPVVAQAVLSRKALDHSLMESGLSWYLLIANFLFEDVEIHEAKEVKPLLAALLEGGASLEQRKQDDWTPLHLVVMRGDIDYTQMLLELGAKTETPDRQGRTALHWAAQIDNELLMALLLEKGANKEAINKFGNTPLHRTADQGKTQTLQWLLEHEANPNAKNINGEIPLIMAAKSKFNNQQNKQKKIEALLNHGAALGIKDTKGRNGLSYIFENLPAAEAESILHKYSGLITRELLNDQDKRGYYPKDWISNRSFRKFVEGLRLPKARDAEIKDAEKKNNRQRLELLQGGDAIQSVTSSGTGT